MDNSRKKLHYLPLQRSFEVTRGHQPSFANNFWSKRDRDVGLVSVCLSWPGKSTDMQYDPFRSSGDLGLTWPEVKLWPWPFEVILYMVRRALTRQTRWYQIRCSIFKIKDFIVEKPFWKILKFWPLETPILTWVKKWPKWFRNDFSRAFERWLSFFSTATRSRDHGGRSNAPPPSRRWEIQRPSRARVKNRAHIEHFTLYGTIHCALPFVKADRKPTPDRHLSASKLGGRRPRVKSWRGTRPRCPPPLFPGLCVLSLYWAHLWYTNIRKNFKCCATHCFQLSNNPDYIN